MRARRLLLALLTLFVVTAFLHVLPASRQFVRRVADRVQPAQLFRESAGSLGLGDWLNLTSAARRGEQAAAPPAPAAHPQPAPPGQQQEEKPEWAEPKEEAWREESEPAAKKDPAAKEPEPAAKQPAGTAPESTASEHESHLSPAGQPQPSPKPQPSPQPSPKPQPSLPRNLHSVQLEEGP